MEPCLAISLQHLGIDPSEGYEIIMQKLCDRRTIPTVDNSDLSTDRKCPNCSSINYIAKDITHRSGDEGEKTVLICLDCGRQAH